MVFFIWVTSHDGGAQGLLPTDVALTDAIEGAVAAACDATVCHMVSIEFRSVDPVSGVVRMGGSLMLPDFRDDFEIPPVRFEYGGATWISEPARWAVASYHGAVQTDEGAEYLDVLAPFSLHPTMLNRMQYLAYLEPSNLAPIIDDDEYPNRIITNILAEPGEEIDDLRVVLCSQGAPANLVVQLDEARRVLVIRCRPEDIVAIMALSGRIVIAADGAHIA